ncbi:MAG: hypothetical protein ACT6RQ_20710 [Hydrogenophaga sp.]
MIRLIWNSNVFHAGPHRLAEAMGWLEAYVDRELSDIGRIGISDMRRTHTQKKII